MSKEKTLPDGCLVTESDHFHMQNLYSMNLSVYECGERGGLIFFFFLLSLSLWYCVGHTVKIHSIILTQLMLPRWLCGIESVCQCIIENPKDYQKITRANQ